MPDALNTILHGNCLDIFATMPEASVDLICTDPPYGYSFMGKDWDRVVIGVEYWAECLRVLKPGAFAFIMSAPRQDVLSRAIVNLQEAGFETGFTSIYWAYASGFPKAMNIGKMVDKRKGTYERGELLPTSRNSGPSPSGAYGEGVQKKYAHTPKHHLSKALDGSYGGFQPKPAVEVIIVAMKPLAEKTFVDQALTNGKGITWLDDCRIPADEAVVQNFNDFSNQHGNQWGNGAPIRTVSRSTRDSRFPANLLVSDDVLHVESRGALAPVRSGQMGFGGVIYGKYATGGDDGRSFHRESSTSFSRYFDLDKWAAETLPFLIVPKASKAEKNRGLEGAHARAIRGRDAGQDRRNVPYKARTTPRVNQHPTVKPVKLMCYLITLGSRPGDIVLDPFAGSGTTCVAAALLGRQYIGIEREYVAIAKARLEATAYSTSQDTGTSLDEAER